MLMSTNEKQKSERTESEAMAPEMYPTRGLNNLLSPLHLHSMPTIVLHCCIQHPVRLLLLG